MLGARRRSLARRAPRRARARRRAGRPRPAADRRRRRRSSPSRPRRSFGGDRRPSTGAGTSSSSASQNDGVAAAARRRRGAQLEPSARDGQLHARARPTRVGAGAAVQRARAGARARLLQVDVRVMDEDGDADLADRSFPTSEPPSVAAGRRQRALARCAAPLHERRSRRVYAAAGPAGRLRHAAAALARLAALRSGHRRSDPARSRRALRRRPPRCSMRSDVLARLSGAELDALAGCVLAGGTLARRRHPPRGPARRHAGRAGRRAESARPTVSSEALPRSRAPRRRRQRRQPGSPSRADASARRRQDARPATRAATCAAASTAARPRTGSARCTCSPSIPRASPRVDDPWVQARMVDLARAAFDRRSTRDLPPGRARARRRRVADVRQRARPERELALGHRASPRSCSASTR